jgi:hypothetical protein
MAGCRDAGADGIAKPPDAPPAAPLPCGPLLRGPTVRLASAAFGAGRPKVPLFREKHFLQEASLACVRCFRYLVLEALDVFERDELAHRVRHATP